MINLHFQQAEGPTKYCASSFHIDVTIVALYTCVGGEGRLSEPELMLLVEEERDSGPSRDSLRLLALKPSPGPPPMPEPTPSQSSQYPPEIRVVNEGSRSFTVPGALKNLLRHSAKWAFKHREQT